MARVMTRRVVALDALRGLAVVLMILDHVLALWPSALGAVARLTVTRLSLPLFMVVAGALFVHRGKPNLERILELGGAGLLVTACFYFLGFPLPDVLLVLVMTSPFWGALLRWPVVVGSLGLLQAVNLPVSLFMPWGGGYEPGYVLLFLALGVLWWRSSGPPSLRDRLPAEIFVTVGRRPLRWYVVHVLVLFIAKGWVL